MNIEIIAFSVQAFVSKDGVVNETPVFVYPIMQKLSEWANSG